MRRAAKAAAEEAESPARVRSPTLSRRLSLQTPFEPGDKFFAAARALWADAAVRGCFDKINPCTFDKVTIFRYRYRPIGLQKCHENFEKQLGTDLMVHTV